LILEFADANKAFCLADIGSMKSQDRKKSAIRQSIWFPCRFSSCCCCCYKLNWLKWTYFNKPWKHVSDVRRTQQKQYIPFCFCCFAKITYRIFCLSVQLRKGNATRNFQFCYVFISKNMFQLDYIPTLCQEENLPCWKAIWFLNTQSKNTL